MHPLSCIRLTCCSVFDLVIVHESCTGEPVTRWPADAANISAAFGMCERVLYTVSCSTAVLRYMASRHLNNPISPCDIRVHGVLITLVIELAIELVIELIHAEIKRNSPRDG